MNGMNDKAKLLTFLAILLASMFVWALDGVAQDAAKDAKDPKATEILQALGALLQSQVEKKEIYEEIKQKLDVADEADKKQLQEQLDAVQSELDKLAQQFQALATGGAAAKFSSSDETELNLRKDFEQLLQPLVVMLKVATEDSRRSNSQTRTACSQFSVRERIERADGIRLLQENNQDQGLTPVLADLEQRWLQHYKESRSLITSLESQLEALQKKRQQSVGRTGAAFTDFIGDRAISLFMGIGAMALVFIVMQLVLRAFIKVFVVDRSRGRSFRVRLVELFYHLVAVCVSIGAMLYVFNARDDWLLLALSTLFLLAFGWGAGEDAA